MILLKTSNYKKSVKFLPKKEQLLIPRQKKITEKSIFNPKLHTKKLKGFSNDKVFSFRITKNI